MSAIPETEAGRGSEDADAMRTWVGLARLGDAGAFERLYRWHDAGQISSVKFRQVLDALGEQIAENARRMAARLEPSLRTDREERAIGASDRAKAELHHRKAREVVETRQDRGGRRNGQAIPATHLFGCLERRVHRFRRRHEPLPTGKPLASGREPSEGDALDAEKHVELEGRAESADVVRESDEEGRDPHASLPKSENRVDGSVEAVESDEAVVELAPLAEKAHLHEIDLRFGASIGGRFVEIGGERRRNIARIDAVNYITHGISKVSDNPRPALYDALYSAMLANRAVDAATKTYTVSGRNCETDMLIPSVVLPEVRSGELQPTPRELIINHIQDILAQYHTACEGQ